MMPLSSVLRRSEVLLGTQLSLRPVETAAHAAHQHFASLDGTQLCANMILA